LSLASFIQDHREQIVQAWMARVAGLPAAQGQSWGMLRDHVPQMLDEIARVLDGDSIPAGALEALAARHAQLRFKKGYDPRQVIAEYQALRRSIIQLYDTWIAEVPRDLLRPVSRFNEMLDLAIADAVEQFWNDHDRARDVFVAILGHDLRTPLQSISIGAQTLLARGERLDDATIKVAVRTAAAASRMETMIRDLLDFARGRLGGGIPVDRTRTDLGAVAAHVVDEITVAYRDREIELARAGGPLIGWWDRERMAQAITNLVSNAIEHGQDPVRVTLSVRPDDEVTIMVENRGEIDAERQTRLFEPFARDPSHRRPTGLGLGLYIVREIARAHGGRVELESKDDRTRFTLIVPRGADPSP
jgi:signal transduction histidine kinase